MRVPIPIAWFIARVLIRAAHVCRRGDWWFTRATYRWTARRLNFDDGDPALPPPESFQDFLDRIRSMD